MIKKTAVKKATSKKSVKKAINKTVPKKAVTKKKVLADPAMNILKTSKCKTVSEKSELTYNMATDEKGNLMLKISSNDGGGYFSREFISFDAIMNKLTEVPEDRPITSIHLFPLFKGKSSNTPGFLLAVLLKEGILVPLGLKRQYKLDYDGVNKFQTKIENLLSSK